MLSNRIEAILVMVEYISAERFLEILTEVVTAMSSDGGKTSTDLWHPEDISFLVEIANRAVGLTLSNLKEDI
jgi:hypothetical protein